MQQILSIISSAQLFFLLQNLQLHLLLSSYTTIKLLAVTFVCLLCSCIGIIEKIHLALSIVHLTALLPPQLTLFSSNSSNLFRGKTSPQQQGYHKLRVPPYVGLSYRDNMFNGEVPAQRSSLHPDEE